MPLEAPMAKDAEDRRDPKVRGPLSKPARLQSAEQASGRRMARGIGFVAASLLAFLLLALAFTMLDSESSPAVPIEPGTLLPPAD